MRSAAARSAIALDATGSVPGMTRTSKVLWALIAVVLCAAAPAGAAVTVGDPATTMGATTDDAPAGLTWVQVTSENATYTAPINGVLTSTTVSYAAMGDGVWTLVT